jgi:transcription elongation factor GreA
MMQKFPITPEGFKAMDEELKHLKTVERGDVIRAIAEARAHGDLSENAEYSSAKEKQGFIEAKIRDLEARIAMAEVIDPAKLSGEVVKFGATVYVIDEETDTKAVFKIVSEYEADLNKGYISLTSPVAKALIGKARGASVEVTTPKGIKYYEIQDVKWV